MYPYTCIRDYKYETGSQMGSKGNRICPVYIFSVIQLEFYTNISEFQPKSNQLGLDWKIIMLEFKATRNSLNPWNSIGRKSPIDEVINIVIYRWLYSESYVVPAIDQHNR